MKNELNIWKIYNEGVTNLINQAIQYFNETILKISLESWNLSDVAKYSTDLEKFKFTDIKKAKDVNGLLNFFKDAPNEYILVNEKGEPAINKDDPNYEQLKLKESNYIKYIQFKSKIYDFVILFTYLKQIQCLRQDSLFKAEFNVELKDKSILEAETEYYKFALQIVNSPVPVPVPESIFWDTTKYDERFLINKIKLNVYAKEINRNKWYKIKHARIDHYEQCNKLYDLLYAAMSKTGVQSQCEALINLGPQIEPFVSRLISFSLFDSEINAENIDVDTTIEFNAAMYNWYKTKLGDNFVEGQVVPQDWVVYKNKAYIKNQNQTINNLSVILYPILLALNGHLNALNATSINLYTKDDINGNRNFTEDLLKQILENNFSNIVTNFSGKINLEIQPEDLQGLIQDATSFDKFTNLFNINDDTIRLQLDTLIFKEIGDALKIDFVIIQMDPFQPVCFDTEKNEDLKDLKDLKKQLIDEGKKDELDEVTLQQINTKINKFNTLIFLVRTVDENFVNYEVLKMDDTNNFVYDSIPSIMYAFYVDNCDKDSSSGINLPDESYIKDELENEVENPDMEPSPDIIQKFEAQLNELTVEQLKQLKQEQIKELMLTINQLTQEEIKEFGLL